MPDKIHFVTADTRTVLLFWWEWVSSWLFEHFTNHPSLTLSLYRAAVEPAAVGICVLQYTSCLMPERCSSHKCHLGAVYLSVQWPRSKTGQSLGLALRLRHLLSRCSRFQRSLWDAVLLWDVSTLRFWSDCFWMTSSGTEDTPFASSWCFEGLRSGSWSLSYDFTGIYCSHSLSLTESALLLPMPQCLRWFRHLSGISMVVNCSKTWEIFVVAYIIRNVDSSMSYEDSESWFRILPSRIGQFVSTYRLRSLGTAKSNQLCSAHILARQCSSRDFMARWVISYWVW